MSLLSSLKAPRHPALQRSCLPTSGCTVLRPAVGAGHSELVATLVVPQLLTRAFGAVVDPSRAARPTGSEVAALAALGSLASASAATRLPVLRALCDGYRAFRRLNGCITSASPADA